MHPVSARCLGSALALSLAVGCGTGSRSGAVSTQEEAGPLQGNLPEAGAQAGDASSQDSEGPREGDPSNTVDAESVDAPVTAGHSSGGADSNASRPSGRLYGVTVDDITDLSEIVSALAALPHKPTTRIVFDETQQPAYYAQAVPAVHAVSFVLGEILDSAFVKDVSVADYASRTSEYLATLASNVDIWEVGNEINGNWLDTTSGGSADVVAKMTGAFDLVRAAGGRTALTLYGCSDADPGHDMFQWAKANVPARMISGLDYVLVSYYEGDCASPRSDWPSVFHQLRQMFPSAGIGFGEVGDVDQNGMDIADASAEASYLQRYYGMQIAEPGYIGGYFWWYFYEDMVPSTKPLFAVLSAAIR